jgi:hypothetical protein
LEVIGEVNVLKVCKQKRRFDVRLARVHSGLQTDWSSTLSVVIRNISDWLLGMASATCRCQSSPGFSSRRSSHMRYGACPVSIA